MAHLSSPGSGDSRQTDDLCHKLAHLQKMEVHGAAAHESCAWIQRS